MRAGLQICVALLVALGCSEPEPTPTAIREITTYPYRADPARVHRIREGARRVLIGMTQTEAAAILGEPDEIRPWVEPKIKNPRQLGLTHWYVIQRLSPPGSAEEKAEITVRLAIAPDHRVVRIDSWGLDDIAEGAGVTPSEHP